MNNNLDLLLINQLMSCIFQLINHVRHMPQTLIHAMFRVLLVGVELDSENHESSKRSLLKFLLQCRLHVLRICMLVEFTHDIIIHAAQQCNVTKRIFLLLRVISLSIFHILFRERFFIYCSEVPSSGTSMITFRALIASCFSRTLNFYAPNFIIVPLSFPHLLISVTIFLIANNNTDINIK